MEKSILITKNLSVGYDHPLISNINLTFNSGEITTFIGPNGSGKSTILKTLAGLIDRKGGDILFYGEDIKSISQKELSKGIGLLLTSAVKAPYMTCREVVETGRYPYTGYFDTLSEKDIEAVEEAVKIADISDIAKRPFTKISDGQRQRVMLARAICQNPRILILDEPASYMDIRYKISFMEIVRGLAKEKNMCIIMSMHEVEFLREVSDYTVCVGDGRISEWGRTADVLTYETIKELFNISDEMLEKYFKQMKGEN